MSQQMGIKKDGSKVRIHKIISHWKHGKKGMVMAIIGNKHHLRTRHVMLEG